ncbi:hypothetical protein Ancab_021341, partial [Ancistrocladus abbreviatus]
RIAENLLTVLLLCYDDAETGDDAVLLCYCWVWPPLQCCYAGCGPCGRRCCGAAVLGFGMMESGLELGSAEVAKWGLGDCGLGS